MSKPIVNIADVVLAPPQMAMPGRLNERFGARMGQIGATLGAQKLGYNLTAIEPGKRAFPFHRIGNETHPIRAGDVIACPPGGQETAHQICNTGTKEMRVLAVSTKQYPEICDYPDSGKFGILSMSPGADGKQEVFRHLARPGSSLDYWDGE
jgi:uncharacterized cupin superfamily protein